MTDPAPRPPLPTRDARAASVRALRAYDILDTDAEIAFDAIVAAAARLFRTPTALISLLDAERQWFKARIGMDCAETPIDQSFCRHAVAALEPMVVLDASREEAFRDNPLVTAEGGIRFYAGAPLLMDGGLAIGSLCVIDGAPRPSCEAADLNALAQLAYVAAELISLRAAARTLARAQDIAFEAR